MVIVMTFVDLNWIHLNFNLHFYLINSGAEKRRYKTMNYLQMIIIRWQNE